MMSTQSVIDQYNQYIMPTYARVPLVITKAKGSRVWDVEGREYLDLFPGWGVSALGYNHPWVTNALRGQSRRVLHVPNNFYQPVQARAAKALIERSFDGKVFFCNSGAEANEAAIKFARYWGQGRYEIMVMERSFHGRTLAAVSATGQDKPQKGFEPLVPGFVRVPFNDREAVARAINPKTVAVLVEPVQGEGGIYVAEDTYLQALRKLCDQHNLLLMFDEVQSGMGRTGRWFAYQHAQVQPDVMVLAKGLGGGFPVGALLVKRALADTLGPGTHGSTYGGNPVACACVLAVIEAVEKQGLLARTQRLSDFIFKRLNQLQEKAGGLIRQVRGRGLMVGIELTRPAQAVVDRCRAAGLIVNATQGNVIRLLPAMTLTKPILRRGLAVLERVILEESGRPQ